MEQFLDTILGKYIFLFGTLTLAIVCFLFIPKLRYWIGVYGTVVHELGHSFFAWTSGNGFSPIKINSFHNVMRTQAYGSSHARAGRWTMFGTLLNVLAGYGFPIMVGFLMIAFSLLGWTIPLLVMFVLLPLLMFLYGRTLLALWFSIAFTLIILPAILYGYVFTPTIPTVVIVYGYILGSFLIVPGIHSYWNISTATLHQGPQGSDFEALTQIFPHTTGGFWVFIEMVWVLSFILLFTIITRILILVQA